MEYKILERNCPICNTYEYHYVWNKQLHVHELSGKAIFYGEKQVMIHGNNVICENCGHIYERFPMTEECLDEFYSNKNEKGISPYREIYTYTQDSIKLHFQHTYEFVKEHGLSQYNSWLDVGSGDPYITEKIVRFSDRGYSFDNSFTHDYNLSKEKLEHELNKEKFDCVTCMNVLEHVYNPIDFLKELRNYIKDDGKLILCVPYVYTKSINMPRDMWFSNAHIHAFSINSLDNACKLAGLNIIDTKIVQEEMGEKIFIACKKSDINTNINIDFNIGIVQIISLFEDMDKVYFVNSRLK